MIKQFVPQERCLACQGCCRFIQEDSVWAPALLNEEVQHFLRQGISAAFISADKKLKIVPFPKQQLFLCPLFNHENNLCKVYDARPLECQLYPFLICTRSKPQAADFNKVSAGEAQKRKIYLAADTNCPFFKEKLNSQEVKEYVRYLVMLLQNPPYAELIRNNPQVIQSYAEVLQLQELSL
jgi:Fe-S-cluster containining protein